MRGSAARVIHIVSLIVAAGTVAVTVTVLTGRDRPSREVLSVRGADISFTLQEEAAGTGLSDGGRRLPIERILAAHGANYVRLRVWVDPPAGYSDEQSVLTLARRATDAGLRIVLNPHYSDFWADPHSQEIPVAWRGADLVTTAAKVREYTRGLVARLAAQGTPVDMVQIGNEITNGMLWPLGDVRDGTRTQWSRLAELVNSAIEGAREGTSGRPVAIVLHVDSGGDLGRSEYFFGNLIQAGVTAFDVIGVSYYPYWTGSLAALRATLDGLARQYHRDILIAETAYPWTLVDPGPGDWVTSPDQLPDAMTVPATPAGQAAFFAELRQILHDVPDGRGLGFLAWEPGWLTVAPKPGEPIPGANLAMFDRDGVGLPSLAAFAPPDATGL
ncbi:Arabinogalactan endo-beta-1,4-galactanase [Frankia sp. Hr75.2]|nr:Arabinogalactan endo-beta-1,4-galactanase [Frankia sp. Hr75.2]SQD98388.1 Arabinogalactan endo-1,4-beta-galactosidase [Parafrankia sp. Ea1.12]